MNRRGGIKLEGEGEWHARKHGGTTRRVWRKIHIAIDEKTMEILAADLTTSDVGDAPMLPELPMLPERLERPDQIPADQQIASVTAHGAFDTRKCHDAIAARHAAAILPPRKNAKPRNPEPREQSPAPKPCAPHVAWVEPSDDDEAAITAEATSKFELGQKTVRRTVFPANRCPASNRSASDLPQETSTVRSPSSKSAWPS